MNQLATDKSVVRSIGLFLGPIVFILFMFLRPFENLSPEGMRVVAVTLWIIVWWISGAVHINVTAMLPLALFPLTGVSRIQDVVGGYSNHLIFLFFGGFFIAIAIERWNLHRRLALLSIYLFRRSLRTMLFAFIMLTGIVSMWISNTATTIMMFAIAMALLAELPVVLKKSLGEAEGAKQAKFIKPALLLSVAYAASIGGVATLIGTPPNVVLAGQLNELFQIELGFVEWMVLGLPLALISLVILWLYMSRVAYKLSDKTLAEVTYIRSEIDKLGKMSTEEKRVLVVFVLVALAWITRRWLISPFVPLVNDSVVSILGALALFLIPSTSREKGNLLDWKSALKAPWGMWFLFGAGFSIAAAFQRTGVTEWIGSLLVGLQGIPVLFIVFILVTAVTFLTEMTSNTATTTILMPIIAGLAAAIDQSPLQLMAAAALAASCAFMLPVATPPNAIVFSSGEVTLNQMLTKGFFLNLIMMALITLAVVFLMPLVLAV